MQFDHKPEHRPILLCLENKGLPAITLHEDKIVFSKDLYLESRDLAAPPEDLEFSVQRITHFQNVPGTQSLFPYFVIGIQANAWHNYQLHFKNPFNETDSNELVSRFRSITKDNRLEVRTEIHAKSRNAKYLRYSLSTFVLGFAYLLVCAF